MKSIILLLFVIGICLVTTGYQKQMLKSYEVKKEVEYRFIPRNIYDEQLGSPQVAKSFVDMFDQSKQDIYLNSPYIR
tara:strand:- start:3884 stop:4114 length:231 start_codon:yes stop_codon:yes gene_type:complete